MMLMIMMMMLLINMMMVLMMMMMLPFFRASDKMIDKVRPSTWEGGLDDDDVVDGVVNDDDDPFPFLLYQPNAIDQDRPCPH